MRRLSEADAVARLKRGKLRFQTHIKLNFEHRALSCRACPTPGVCCTDAHFVNVHITRLEAVAIRDTLALTPRLSDDERRAVYLRAAEAVGRYGLASSGDTFAQTFSCPLFTKGVGCLVHQRAKPAPCVQHACYEDWADVPPLDAQWREEGRIERLNTEAYGTAWEWLPLPVWLTLVDPYSDGAELRRLARAWGSRPERAPRERAPDRARPKNRTLPVLRA
ncbi:MAG TPA: hypothetical protein VF591_28945 [Pyrinomonadaceae bacterium]|jgi:hypothetical protein